MKYLKTFEQISNEEDDFIDDINFGNIEKVKSALKKNKALVDIRTNSWTNNLTPLMYAAAYNRLEIAKILLENNAEINTQNNEGGTALMIAAGQNHFDITIFLIESGADWYIKDKRDNDFLDYLSEDRLEYIIEEFDEKWQEYLVKKNADKYNL